MAAADSNDDDSGNIWSGYVDALTTMTMVMTLIMMLLGIVVFGLSQQISRSFLVKIAEATNVDASANRTASQIAGDILERLAKRPDQVGFEAAARGAAAQQGTHGAAREQDADGIALQPLADDGTAVSGRDRATAAAASGGSHRPAAGTTIGTGAGASFDEPKVAGQAPIGDSPSQRAGAGPTDLEVTSDLTAALAATNQRRVGSTMAPAIKDSPPVAATAPVEIESTREADLVRPGEGAKVGSGLATINIKFKDKATLLDAVSAQVLRSSVADPTSAFRTARLVEIAAAADPSNGTLSDARRFAYYRVLTVRKEILSAGIDASRVIMKIDDSLTVTNSNTVRLTARP
ncbi:hypothetical protein [uncultured Alsobacter sp.]|uniref:hypothetical protein n=1 Tax=uncultured Alsobacter sp. TaxID=1748258 RepID=UPI0025F6B598|nr:hypothetical protein [uncultured Alsobacter sp.]